MIFDTATNAVEKIPQPAGRCNDTDPMWLGDKIYFRSDRAGEFNLFSYDPKTKQVEQRTRFAEWPMLNANAGGGRIIFERAGYLSLFDPQTRKDARLKIGVAADLVETRARFVKGAKYIRWGTLSPASGYATHLVGDFDNDGFADDIASFHSTQGSWQVSLGNAAARTFMSTDIIRFR